MKHVLPMLIRSAQEARDAEAARLVQAQSQHAQQCATLARLREFRQDCIARSAAATLGHTRGEQLADYQRFMLRLDDAIAQQTEVTRRCERAAEQQQQRLVATQQRLLAFETLSRREAQREAERENRRSQREIDEFASRAAMRQAARP